MIYTKMFSRFQCWW